MKRTMIYLLLVSAAIAVGCGQFNDQVSVRPYEQPQLQPPEGTVAAEAGAPVHPSAEEMAAMVEPGRMAYRRYCWACHGPQLDGNGTVGPSFPRSFVSLTDDSIVEASDEDLFEIITEGSGMHPPLLSTMLDADVWRAIAYVRAVQRGDLEPGAPEAYAPGVNEKLTER